MRRFCKSVERIFAKACDITIPLVYWDIFIHYILDFSGYACGVTQIFYHFYSK